MNGREPSRHPEAARKVGLDLDKRDVGFRLDHVFERVSMRLEQQRFRPPACSGAGLPVAATRCISLIATEGLTAKQRAA